VTFSPVIYWTVAPLRVSDYGCYRYLHDKVLHSASLQVPYFIVCVVRLKCLLHSFLCVLSSSEKVC